jgi:predicted Zn-dependent protease with MMP-like domain
MKLPEFESAARAVWEKIPDQYKEGIDALTIEDQSHTHPEHEDFFTLGECVTEAYPSEIGGPDTIRSAVVLYYGSFRAVAAEHEDFPWQAEIEETLLHELQHHLEHLADDDALADFDYAVEENFKRVEGQPFDPLFFRAGEVLGNEVFRVEDDVFITTEAGKGGAFAFEFEWKDGRYRVAIPDSTADVLYVVIEQEMPGVAGDLCVVRLRRMNVLGTLRAALTRRGYSVEEVFVEAELA